MAWKILLRCNYHAAKDYIFISFFRWELDGSCCNQPIMYEHGAWSGMVRAFWILFYTRFQAKFETGLDYWKWHSHWHSHWYTGKWPVCSGVFVRTLSTWIQGVSGFWACKFMQVVPFHQLTRANNNNRPLLFPPPPPKKQKNTKQKTANLNWFQGSGGVLFPP